MVLAEVSLIRPFYLVNYSTYSQSSKNPHVLEKDTGDSMSKSKVKDNPPLLEFEIVESEGI